MNFSNIPPNYSREIFEKSGLKFFQYRPILAVKFLTASRVCAAKVGAGIKKEPPLREALGEISFAVMFLHKESFGSSTSLMPYK